LIDKKTHKKRICKKQHKNTIMAEVQQPIIIKKITVNAAAHHGGAWKVAYADFVTAMMAFFLLLWLLAVSSDASLQGIADYFTPTIGLKDSKGIGFEGGTTDELEEGTQRNTKSRPNLVNGQPPQGVKPLDPKKKVVIDSPDGESQLFEKSATAIEQAVKKDASLKDLGENLRMEQTPEGLKIQILDTEKDPMFMAGSVDLTDAGKRLIGKVGEVIKGMPNRLSITGHTDGVRFVSKTGMSNWELSSERANAARRYLSLQGMIEERMSKVQGRADKELLFAADPKNPKNRRIELLLLRGDYVNVPIEDNPAGGLTPIQDQQNDTLSFEDEAEARAADVEKSKAMPKAKPYTPAISIPDKPIKEDLSGAKDALQFTPH
jgi:chemotaxis protein MotB